VYVCLRFCARGLIAAASSSSLGPGCMHSTKPRAAFYALDAHSNNGDDGSDDEIDNSSYEKRRQVCDRRRPGKTPNVVQNRFNTLLRKSIFV
jgi:hypothetical protein